MATYWESLEQPPSESTVLHRGAGGNWVFLTRSDITVTDVSAFPSGSEVTEQTLLLTKRWTKTWKAISLPNPNNRDKLFFFPFIEQSSEWVLLLSLSTKFWSFFFT